MNKITIDFTVEQLNVVIGALAKLPLEVSLDAFTAIRAQADAQVQQAQAQMTQPDTQVINTDNVYPLDAN